MTTRRQLILSASSVFLGAWLLPAEGEAGSPGTDLAVVVAKQSALDGLSLQQLKHLYLGDTILGPGGDKLLALNRDPKSPERVGFDRSVLEMTPEGAARYWIDRKIRGQSGAPRAVEPASVAQRVVARLPAALTYVRANEVSGEVKVLRIDGKKPGDSGYPIRADVQAKAALDFLDRFGF